MDLKTMMDALRAGEGKPFSLLRDKEKIEQVVHFAAFSIVPESVANPLKYFDNNTSGMITLLEVMKAHDVKQIVFSSTAATYGNPVHIPIKETDPQNPIIHLLQWYLKLYLVLQSITRTQPYGIQIYFL